MVFKDAISLRTSRNRHQSISSRILQPRRSYNNIFLDIRKTPPSSLILFPFQSSFAELANDNFSKKRVKKKIIIIIIIISIIIMIIIIITTIISGYYYYNNRVIRISSIALCQQLVEGSVIDVFRLRNDKQILCLYLQREWNFQSV